jgi:hypothetical protein
MNTTLACSKPPALSARSRKGSHKDRLGALGPVDATPASRRRPEVAFKYRIQKPASVCAFYSTDSP